MKKTKIALFAFVLFILPAVAFAGRNVTLPWTMNFDDNSWLSDLRLTECGGTSTHVTTGCYGGGCMKVTPPTSPCTGGGINGGQTGLGWVTYTGSPTTEIHIRFLIKFGSAYATNVANGGGGLINKFLLQDSPSRAGILGLNGSDTSGRYLAFGVLNAGESYVFRTPPNRGWIEDALFRVSSTQHVNEWIAVEYWINTATARTGLYIWTQDGTFNGAAIENVPAEAGINMTGFYISYFNCFGVANANNYYMMDNFAVSRTYIGPPSGFGGSNEILPPPNFRKTSP